MRDERAILLWELDPGYGHAPWRGTPARPERVLHVHLATPQEPQTALCNALASLACEGGYRRIDWTSMSGPELQQLLPQVARAHAPTLVFLQLQAAGVVTPATLAEVRAAAGAPELVIATWCGDVAGANTLFPVPQARWASELAPHCDLVLFSSMSHVRAHRSRGMHRAAYLQIGYDEDRYFEGADDGYGARFDAVLLATHYDDRSVVATLPGHEARLRRELARAFSRGMGSRFGLFGGGWGQGVGSVTPAASGDVYRGAHLGLSVSLASWLERYSSDRLFRILACGCTALVKRFDDCASYGLRDGETAVLFDEAEGALAAARALLAPERRDELRAIGRRGAQLARDHHSWAVRMRELVPLLAAARGARVEVERPW
jgi:hypothetical protein